MILTIPNDFELSLIGDSPKRIGIDVNGINAMKGGLGSQYMVQLVMQTFGELQQEKSVVVSPDLFTVQNRYNPTLDYKHFMIPALMIMLLVMICGFLPALNLVSEKEIGTIEQINVTPVSRLSFTLAKLIPYWIIGFSCIDRRYGVGMVGLRAFARRFSRLHLSGGFAFCVYDVGYGGDNR